MKLRIFFSLLTLVPLTVGCVRGAEAASASETSVAVAKTVRALKAAPIPYPDFPVVIAPQTQALLAQLKTQLRDLAEEAIRSQGNRGNDPREIRAAIVEQLRVAGIVVGPDKTIDYGNSADATYGDILRIEVTNPEGHPDLIGVRITLGIACGDDSSLYLFQAQGRDWKLILAWGVDEYGAVSQALGHFAYAVSPPDQGNHWYVLTASINPYCSSVWRTLHFQVMRTGPVATKPAVVFEHEEIGRWDHPLDVEAHPRWLRVNFMAWQKLDSLRNYREHVEEYAIGDEGLKRVAPIAWAPQNFLDEWLDMPWGQAAQWANRAASSSLKQWHDRLGGDARDGYSSEVLFVQPCDEGEPATRWQIGVSVDTLPKSAPLPKHLYFSVSARAKDLYLVDDVSSRRAPGCPGETPP